MQVKHKKHVIALRIELDPVEIEAIRDRLVELHSPRGVKWSDCPELNDLDNAFIDFLDAGNFA